MHPASTRRQHLIAAMGLRYDPFESSVSENDTAPDFGSVYVDRRPSLLDRLRMETINFVFADYGMGKTATRLALEYLLRSTPDASPTLCVRYTPHVDRKVMGTTEQLRQHHLRAIAQEMTIDLLIQLLERLAERPLGDKQHLTPAYQAALRRQVQALPPRMWWSLQAAAHDEPVDGTIWPRERPVVRRNFVNSTWQAVVKQMAAAVPRTRQPVPWEATLADVRELGFKTVYLLIDAVDESEVNPDDIYAMVIPLLEAMREFRDESVFLKWFLPMQLQKPIRERYIDSTDGLTGQIAIDTIQGVSPIKLQAIVDERFQAASTSNESLPGLDWFISPDLGESIQHRLVEMAKGSPRRIIDLVSRFLDFHSTHGFQDNGRLQIRSDEWHQFIAQLNRLNFWSP